MSTTTTPATEVAGTITVGRAALDELIEYLVTEGTTATAAADIITRLRAAIAELDTQQRIVDGTLDRRSEEQRLVDEGLLPGANTCGIAAGFQLEREPGILVTELEGVAHRLAGRIEYLSELVDRRTGERDSQIETSHRLRAALLYIANPRVLGPLEVRVVRHVTGIADYVSGAQ